MATTNRNNALIIAGVAALNIPLPFDGYLKPEIEWVDINTPEYYTLNEIDNTSILGHKIKIRKDEDGLYFVYSDSDIEHDDGDYDVIKQTCIDFGIEVRILTSPKRQKEVLSNSAGIKQIGNWVNIGIN
jgi:hypothetical protein